MHLLKCCFLVLTNNILFFPFISEKHILISCSYEYAKKVENIKFSVVKNLLAKGRRVILTVEVIFYAHIQHTGVFSRPFHAPYLKELSCNLHWKVLGSFRAKTPVIKWFYNRKKISIPPKNYNKEKILIF
jgi:hypothetical protein